MASCLFYILTSSHYGLLPILGLLYEITSNYWLFGVNVCLVIYCIVWHSLFSFTASTVVRCVARCHIYDSLYKSLVCICFMIVMWCFRQWSQVPSGSVHTDPVLVNLSTTTLACSRSGWICSLVALRIIDVTVLYHLLVVQCFVCHHAKFVASVCN